VGSLPIDVWVGGLNTEGYLYIHFKCIGKELIEPYTSPVVMYLKIKGQGKFPPVNTTCDSQEQGCYNGMYVSSYCSLNKTLYYNSICSPECCKKYGGIDAMCTPDRKSCITNSIPPGQNGKIALLCKTGKCSERMEKRLMILFKYMGWDPKNFSYDKLNEEELDEYDIIVCSDQSKSCKINFNSPAYNEHMDKDKPFLEIPNKNSAKAGYSFGYFKKVVSRSAKNILTLNESDYITQGINETFTAVNARDVAVIEDRYLSSEAKNLIDAVYKKGKESTLFKIDNSYGHGRYAYIGWFYKTDVYEITQDGVTILNNTLLWLKYGDSFFKGQTKTYEDAGKIAFVCQNDLCSKVNEQKAITWFRDNSFSVSAKSQKSWDLDSLSNSDFIVCLDKKSCTFDKNSPIYISHMNGKGFLEFPDKAKAYAGYAFGYLNSSSGFSLTNSTVINLNDAITSIFSQTLKVFDKGLKMLAIPTKYLENAKDLSDTKTFYSVIFRTETPYNRYAYIGLFNGLNNLTGDGKELLLRTARWVQCGNPNTC
jgi:hypothetical protein